MLSIGKIQTYQAGEKQPRNFNVSLRVPYIKTEKGGFTKDKRITQSIFL